MRNLIAGSQLVHDHVIHFYHLHALDWVDVVSALKADPARTARLAQSLSDWPRRARRTSAAVRARMQGLADAGQLSLFGNGYWGHPAYRLTPEENLLAVAHYLEALEWQRDVIRIHAVLGGKNPHPQTFLVGGMAAPLDPSSPQAINPERIGFLRERLAHDADVRRAGLPARRHAPRLGLPRVDGIGAGTRNFLTYGGYGSGEVAETAPLPVPAGHR